MRGWHALLECADDKERSFGLRGTFWTVALFWAEEGRKADLPSSPAHEF